MKGPMPRRVIYISSLVAMLVIANTGISQQIIRIQPDQKFQKLKGFGVSLCWWANIMGGWGDSAVHVIAKDLAGKDELNFNYFRFNIGGGDDPSHHHMRKDGGAMPGYRASATAAYDWLADSNQVGVLKQLHTIRPDAIYEAFSNSPPYWMTISGCASGNAEGKENLRENAYGLFADYLTDIVKHFKEDDGILFSRVEPFNEPFSNWWKEKGGQEGCQFLAASQQRLIDSIYERLSVKNMLAYCSLSVMDANTIDETVNGIKSYSAAHLSKLSDITTHSYAGTQRAALKLFAQENKIEVWQSESGPLSIPQKGLDNYLVMAGRIIKDLKEMGAVIWTDWQAVSLDDGWGLWIYNIDKKIVERKKPYYIRKQFSKYIQPGYTVIGSGEHTIAALNESSDELVVVIVNGEANSYPAKIDLGGFANAGAATVLRTSAKEDCNKLPAVKPVNKSISYTVPGKSVTTFVIPVKLF